jgi:hypothetical protein
LVNEYDALELNNRLTHITFKYKKEVIGNHYRYKGSVMNIIGRYMMVEEVLKSV